MQTISWGGWLHQRERGSKHPLKIIYFHHVTSLSFIPRQLPLPCPWWAVSDIDHLSHPLSQPLFSAAAFALCSSRKIFFAFLPPNLSVSVTLIYFIPVTGKSDHCAVEDYPFLFSTLSSAAVKDQTVCLLSHVSLVCFLYFLFILTL